MKTTLVAQKNSIEILELVVLYDKQKRPEFINISGLSDEEYEDVLFNSFEKATNSRQEFLRLLYFIQRTCPRFISEPELVDGVFSFEVNYTSIDELLNSINQQMKLCNIFLKVV
ncbi:MAG: hypothetical protein ACRCXZ_07765 [Patescibacteria group bacterium]